MKTFIKEKKDIFLLALLQLTLGCMNTIFITNNKIILMLLVSFVIEVVYTFNVRKIVFGGRMDRLIYSFGGMCGTGLGYFLANYMKTLM